jgi:hypothetical protein
MTTKKEEQKQPTTPVKRPNFGGTLTLSGVKKRKKQ